LLALGAAALLAAPSALAQPSADAAAENRVRAHVEFLAHDLLEGRATGERGYDIAAEYVASRFRALGLKPGGENGSWYQMVPFRRATEARPTTAGLVVDGKRSALRSGDDIVVPPSLTETERRIDSELVFVGHGISDPRLGIDDYAGLDVRGKTVVALRAVPDGTPSEIAAHLGSTKAHAAAARGAIGYIAIGKSRSRRPGAGRAGQPDVDWIDSAGRAGTTPAGLRFTATVSEAVAERLFEGAPATLAQIRSDGGRRGPKGFALKPRLAIESASTWHDFKSPEVIGLLPGADPALKGEHVVLMGHLDHVGINRNAKPGEDAIFNGALDNAAGVATMIEAAEQFVRSARPPRRSVLFIANTGEELGLLGADYYAKNPTVPIRDIVAAVDLDMPVPLYDFTDVVAFGADHSTVVRNVEDAARSMGMSVSPDPMPEQAIFTRSDHYRFVQQGVPAILLFTGYANGGKAKWDHFFANVYHRPSDDLSQDINWRAAARYAELNYRISRALADADSRPLWYQGDYFEETFAPGQPRAAK
jgi:hypothetical protein